MNPQVNGPLPQEIQARARRAKCIIIWVAAILMGLPPVLAWLTGSIQF